MKIRTLIAQLAAAAVAGALMTAAPLTVAAQEAKPSDYGVKKGAPRADADPMLLGQFVYSQRCKVCHARKSDGQTKYGPHLEGIFGRKAAATPYGEHTPALETAGVVWDEKMLDALLRDPQKAVPGTKMETVVRFRRSRKALITYLKTL